MFIGIVIGSFLFPIMLMTIDILSRKKGNRLKSYHNEMKLLWSISRSKITNVFVERQDKRTCSLGTREKSGDIYYVTDDDVNNDFKIIVEKYFIDCLIVSQLNIDSLTTATTTISFGTICPFKKYLLKKSRIR